MQKQHSWQGSCATALALACLQVGAHAAPTAYTGHLTGTAIDALSGQPLAGAQVTAGQRSTVTDAQGRFDLDVPAAAGQTVRATAPGHAPGLLRVDVSERALTLATLTLTPAAGNTRVLDLGASASATLTPIDPANHAEAMPGSYLQGVGASTQAIETFGVVNLVARDRLSAQRLDLAPGARTTIRIPAASRGAPLPTTLALSSLNEASGLWIEEGSATLRGSGASLYYEGSVSHLGFWSATRPVPTVQVHGSVCQPEGIEAAAATARTDALDRAVGAEARVLPDGSFHTAIPWGAQARLQVRSSTGQQTESLILGPSGSDITLATCLPWHAR